MIRAVVFDVGETLVDETRQWQSVANALGVPPFTLAGVLGGVIERRQDHRCMFELFDSPHVSAMVGDYRIEARDLYPDVLPALGLPVDLVASSTAWGAHKPDPAFFIRIGEELHLPHEVIAYVGDRLDNDVLPAQRAGMTGVFIRRRPWGYLQAGWPEMQDVRWQIGSLMELPAVLASMKDGELAHT